MRLGLAMPVSLRLMQDLVDDSGRLPAGYEFAPSVDWLRAFLRRGHEVTVYTTARDVDADVSFRGPRLTVRIARARGDGAGRDLFYAERTALTRMMEEDGCDLIHAHWTYEFALAALASGLPAVVTVHDLPWNVLRYFRDRHRVAKVLMAYQTAWNAEHVTAVSTDAARHFRRYFAPWARVDVVPNGLPGHVFQMAAGQPTRPEGAVTFATNLQGWSARKNAATALQAFAAVRAQLPGAKLLMVGRDYQRGGPAEQWASARGLAADVTFAGTMPYARLLERMAAETDILVHPSLDESFSMASVEAMALRKPVIAGARTPGVREVLGYGSAGLLADVTRAASLAEAMLRLARDPAGRTRVAQAGYERAWSTYRLDTVIQMYEEMYDRVLEAHVRRRHGHFRHAGAGFHPPGGSIPR